MQFSRAYFILSLFLIKKKNKIEIKSKSLDFCTPTKPNPSITHQDKIIRPIISYNPIYAHSKFPIEINYSTVLLAAIIFENVHASRNGNGQWANGRLWRLTPLTDTL
jgi:hypothetical protein